MSPAGAAALTLLAIWTIDSFRSRGDGEAEDDDGDEEASEILDEAASPIVD